MTSLASVILSGAKNLSSCRAMTRKSQTDPLLEAEASSYCRTIAYIIESIVWPSFVTFFLKRPSKV